MIFTMEQRRIKLTLHLPAFSEFQTTPTGKQRSASAAEDAYEQAMRQRWRALVLIIKAKLEAIESGISTLDQEFLANIVLPNQQTVGELMVPQLKAVTARGEMPALPAEFGD